jgi:molybdopterin-containing oxidoreductase family membrane subunit
MQSFFKEWFISYIKPAWERVISGGWIYLAFIFFFGILMFIGISAGIHALFIAGTRHTYGTYREIPVAILISTYIFFVVASTGLCIVSSIGHVFGVRSFMPIAKRSVFLSIITILAGFLVIGLEIEHPFRMAIYNIISPNFSSNIWWMGTLYGFYLIFMSIEFILLLHEHHKFASFFGLCGVISGIAAHSNLGGIFAMMHGRPYWYGAYPPIYFIASAMMTGCAFIIFFTLMAYRIKRQSLEAQMNNALQIISKLTMLMLVIVMFFTTWKMLTTSVGGPLAIAAYHELISGHYSFSFWGIEIIGGMMIPFILLLIGRGKNMTLMFTASVFMIFSIFFMRLDMVVVGQIVPQYFELGVVEYSKLHSYSPSVHEILVVLGGISFCLLAFLLGEKIFSGFTDPQHNQILTEKESDVVGVQELP